MKVSIPVRVNNHQFRRIIDARQNLPHVVPQSAADDDLRAGNRLHAFGQIGQEALIRCVERAEERKANLTTVRVAEVG